MSEVKDQKPKFEALSLGEYHGLKDLRLDVGGLVERSSYDLAFLAESVTLKPNRQAIMAQVVLANLNYDDGSRVSFDAFLRNEQGRETGTFFPGYVLREDNLWYPKPGTDLKTIINKPPIYRRTVITIVEGFLSPQPDALEDLHKTSAKIEVPTLADLYN